MQSYEDAHWFCPKRSDDDDVDYHNLEPAAEGSPDMNPAMKLELLKDAKDRQDVAYKYTIALGLDNAGAARMLTDYTQRVDTLLSTCSDCIRNYHMGRKAYLKYLHECVIQASMSGCANR